MVCCGITRVESAAHLTSYSNPLPTLEVMLYSSGKNNILTQKLLSFVTTILERYLCQVCFVVMWNKLFNGYLAIMTLWVDTLFIVDSALAAEDHCRTQAIAGVGNPALTLKLVGVRGFESPALASRRQCTRSHGLLVRRLPRIPSRQVWSVVWA